MKKKFLLRIIYSISLGSQIAKINKIICSCASKAQSICEIKMQMEIIKQFSKYNVSDNWELQKK